VADAADEDQREDGQRRDDEDERRLRRHPDAADEQVADEQHDRDAEHVDGPALAGRGGDRVRQADARHLVEQRVEIAREADGHRGRADRELEHEVPADDERDQLAERRERVRVGAARGRHHRRQLGVAERRERADDARENEGQRDPRAGLGRRRLARQDEDAGADHRPDADDDDVERAEVATQLVRLELGGRERLVDRLARSEQGPARGCAGHGALRTRADARSSRGARAV